MMYTSAGITERAFFIWASWPRSGEHWWDMTISDNGSVGAALRKDGFTIVVNLDAVTEKKEAGSALSVKGWR